MYAVIFEAEFPAQCQSRYLELAEELKPLLAEVDGFLSIERFQSLSQPGKILSLSWWRDEAALLAWRTQFDHQAAQHEGRSALFSHYRIRVASVVRDYSKTDRAQAPVAAENPHGAC